MPISPFGGESDDRNGDLQPKDTQVKQKQEKTKKEGDEMSEEDQALKDGLELAVMRLKDEVSVGLHEAALKHLCKEIKSSTSSMTSVPKPLKYLSPYYHDLKTIFEKWHPAHDLKQIMSDMLSVLAMTMQEVGSRECLKFKLQGTTYDIASWGHEYVRCLAGEIAEEYNSRLTLEQQVVEDEVSMDDIMSLVDDIIAFQMTHNAEAEAVDLLMEVQQLSKLVENSAVDDRNYERVCLYLLKCGDYISDPDDLQELYLTAYLIYKNQKKFAEALRIALKMEDIGKIDELFNNADVPDSVQKQMSFILARNKSKYETKSVLLNEIIGNEKLSELYVAVGKEMDILGPKSPEDIYKSHLAEGSMNPRTRGANNTVPVDSARTNLASSFVNAFVNAGFGSDKLMTLDNCQWVYKNKDHAMLSAAASLGMILLWNVDTGLNEIDRFFHNSEDYVKAGGCLALGIMCTGTRNESDPAMAILSEYLENSSHAIRTAAIMGLGLAYASSERTDIQELLTPIVVNTEGADMIEVSLAALSLGLIFSGTCNDDVGAVIVSRLMESSDDDLNNKASRFLALGLGLLYLGQHEKSEAMSEAVRVVQHKFGRYAELTLQTCAYAGTGNVIIIQKMLHYCAEHVDDPKQVDHQAVAVLGIALVAMREDIGREMSMRTFDHLLQYGNLTVKRVVPLALALLFVSNPDYAVVDQLSRLSHDPDQQVAQGAIFSLGLVSAGSNNSRVAGLLRQLSEFYSKEANHLFIVRIAQGLNAMGKGLLTLNPFHSDRFLMCPASVGGLLTVLHAALDFEATILDKMHYVLYYLAASMNPKFVVTLSSDLTLVKSSVRVGQAVETVGQAGRPRTITGFQTHSTPVLLGHSDRAEMATNEYKPVVSIVEGIVILERVEDNVLREIETVMEN